jgi:hypothetical protein
MRTGNILDEQMVDRGLSGYHGTHRKKGYLGKFLAKVKAGEVPRGSKLVIEKVSRLSREGLLKALKNSVFELIEHGITLQFLEPELAFDRQSMDGPLAHVLIALLQSAFQESKDKSYYARQTWERKQKQARQKRILTAMCPNWLRVVNGKFEVIPEAAESIRMIFDLKLAGLGMGTIERKLNLEAPWTPPKKPNGWRISYVKKILVNSAVIGVYQPFVREEVPIDPKERNGEMKAVRTPAGEPIPDYYPAIVDAGIFHQVQKLLRQKGKMDGNGGGRLAKAKNLFPYLARCAYCQGPMAYTDKGGRGGKWYICDHGRRGKECSSDHRIHYDELETTILTNCHKLRPDQILPDPDQQARGARALREKLASLEGKLAAIEQQEKNVKQHLRNTSDDAMRQHYEEDLRELAKDREEQERNRAAVQAESDRAEAGLTSISKWKADLDTLRQHLDNVEVRQRLQAHLRELIDRIEVFTDGEPDNEDDIYQEVWEVDPGFVPDQEFRDFVQYVVERVNSKDGRFLRVHFKTGAFIRLVPPGSIAAGMELDTCPEHLGPWIAKFPTLGDLWQEFTKSKKKRKRRKSLSGQG